MAYDHLIPKTYLRAWVHSKDSVYVCDKKTGVLSRKNIENNFGRTHFHSISAGMPICEHSDLVDIFRSVNGYDVYYQDRLLETLEEYNNYYYDFANWVIKKSGVKVTKRGKNQIRADIEQVKIDDVENLWNKKYENRWNQMKDIIIYKVMTNSLNEIDEFYKGLIMKFIIAFNWRGFYGNDTFKNASKWILGAAALHNVDIPFEVRQKPYLETASEEIEHMLLLRKYREFLRDKGIMYDMAKLYIRLLSLQFYIAEGNTKFITSDNPSFIVKINEDKNVHLMPVSPEILICIGRNSDCIGKYKVERISDEDVEQFNKLISENSFERIISINNF